MSREEVRESLGAQNVVQHQTGIGYATIGSITNTID
jgi:hypothetical protein